MRKTSLSATGVGILVALAGLSAVARAAEYSQAEIRSAAPKPASIVVTPSGATLKPGDQLQFSAVAYDKNGNVFPGATFAWSSTSSTIASVDGTGMVTAHTNGQVTVSAKVGNKVSNVGVTVVSNPGSGEITEAAGLKQVNHVLVDDDWIYWTEVAPNLVRVRKMAKTGGAIFDLVSEPAHTQTGAGESYVHLAQSGDTLYYSRQTLGFNSHWSIRAIPKAGGTPTVILPENASATPMYSDIWRVVGQYVVVVLFYPSKIHLPDNTRVAYFNTQDSTWHVLVGGADFDINKVHIVASDDQNVYIRGYNYTGQTVTERLTPGSGQPAVVLHTMNDLDLDYSQAGTMDSQFLYFWTQRTGTDHRLVSMSVNGGGFTTLTTGSFGTGLNTDGQDLYWARNQIAVVKVPVTGGTPALIRQNVYKQSTLAPLALDDAGIYLPVVPQQSVINLVRDPK